MTSIHTHPLWQDFTATNNISECIEKLIEYHTCYHNWYELKSVRSRSISVISLLLGVLYVSLGLLYGGGNFFSNHTIFSKFTAYAILYMTATISFMYLSLYSTKLITIRQKSFQLDKFALFSLHALFAALTTIPLALLYDDFICITNSLIPIGIFLLLVCTLSYLLNKFEGFTRAAYRHRYYLNMLELIKYRFRIDTSSNENLKKLVYELIESEINARNSDILKDFDHFSRRITGTE